VRHFAPTPLPAGLLEQLVAAGQQAATSSNLQTWSVVAIEDPDRKNRAATLCAAQKFIRDAPVFLIFCADLARLKSVSTAVEHPGAALDYLEMLLTAVIDTALAAQNVVVAASLMGRDTLREILVEFGFALR
jgi:nitroreductase